MNKINISIYGGRPIFGGREVPRRAEIIYCDKHKSCSLYQKKQCLNVTAPFSGNCKYGRVVIEKGYTSRARKYGNLKRKYANDPAKNALSGPSNCKIAKIEDEIYINIPYVNFKKDGSITNEAFCSNNTIWMHCSDFTVDFIKNICSLRPQAMMGGTIKSYQEKEVPEFLLQLHTLLPTLYNNFINKYPEYSKPFNYVGKKAYVRSLRNGIVLKKDGTDFIIKGNKLVCDKYKILFSPFNAGLWHIESTITDDMVAEITSNDQVDCNTIFKD